MSKAEDLFRESFSGFRQEPPEKVWRNIETRLFWRNFLNFSPKTLNIWYLATVAAGGFFAADYFMTSEKTFNIESMTTSRHEYSASKRKVLIDNSSPTLTTKTSEEKLPQLSKQSTFYETTDTDAVLQHSDTQSGSATETTEIKIPDFTSYFKMSSATGCAPFTVSFQNLSENTEYCYWNFGNGDVSYDNDGKTTYRKAGQYFVTLKTVNGIFSKVYTDTVRVYEQPEAQIAYVVSSKTLVAEARNSKAAAFAWLFGDNQKAVGEKVTHTYSDFGVYPLKLVISNNICTDTVTAEIQIRPQQYSVKFPNAMAENSLFLPGGDTDKILRYFLRIMNRNGKEVFATSDPRQGWDGRYKGEKLPKGVYVYYCQFEFVNGERGNLTGNITLVGEKEY